MKLFFSRVMILTIVLANGLVAGPGLPQQFSDRFLFAFKSETPSITVSIDNGLPVTGIASVDALMSQYGVTGLERWIPEAGPEDGDGKILIMNIYRASFPSDRDLSSLRTTLAAFSADQNLLYAELENINYPVYAPNDTRFNSEWHLPRVGATQAWDLWDIAGGNEPGSRDIVLASVDTGVQYTHPDLKNNAWINQGEIPSNLFAAIDADNSGVVTSSEIVAYVGDANSNGTADLQDAVSANSPLIDGVDNELDGYVDDILGWDIAGTTSGVDSDRDPMAAITGAAWQDYRAHGTHVAGLLAAETDNGAGVASAIFNGLIMSVKCMYDQDANGYVSGGYSGVLYAAKAGADIINLSWGGFGGSSSSEQTIINTAYNTYGALIVAAAGNGNDNGTPNNDIHFPSAYDNVVSITAVSASDVFSWATYGPTVDMSAPGEGIWSTVFTTMGSYQAWPGTSMASPLTASCFGLMKSMNPTMSNDEMVSRMLAAADPIDDINPNYAGGLGTGRVNVYNALAQIIFPKLSFNATSIQITNDDGDGQLGAGEGAYLRVLIENEANWTDAQDVTGQLFSSSPYVTITDSLGTYGAVQNGNVASNLFDRYQFELADDTPSGDLPFTLHLAANEATAHPYTIDLDFTLEVSMWQPHFPIHMRQAIISGNAVVDLNGDGIMEIIVGAEDSLVHAFEPDGSELSGFPVLLGSKIEATPAVGDVNNDGRLEIVIGSWDKNLYLIYDDGVVDTIFTSTGYLMATPTLANLDSDADLEIIQPGYNQELMVLNYDGTFVDGFPIVLPVDEKMTKGAAVVDLNEDGQLDIIVGTWGNKLHAFQLDGTEVSGFPVLVGGKLVSAPTVANIDNAGGPEIIIGSDNDELYAISNTGSILWTFSDPIQNLRMSPGVGDINNDGSLEIFFASYDRKVYGLTNSGQLLDGWPYTTGSTISSSPVLADVDNDGLPEVFIGSDDNGLYGFRGTGELFPGFPIALISKVQGTPTIANIDGDGDLEVIVGSDSLLAVIDIKTPAGELGYWSTARGNLARTGIYGEPSSGIVGNRDQSLPESFRLEQNYPNPFNPSTEIEFSLPIVEKVELVVRDITGRRVTTLYSGAASPGVHTVKWSGLDDDGHAVGSGIYLYQLKTSTGIATRKMLLVK